VSGKPWTIDSITHALPHPELRACFQREVSFTEVGKLPAILQRWVQFIADVEAGRVEADRISAYVRDHGQLPDGYDVDTRESVAQYEELKARLAAHRQGHHAA
jgi:hypothetical protein